MDNSTKRYYHKWTCDTPFDFKNNFCFRVHSCFVLQQQNSLEAPQRIPILNQNGCIIKTKLIELKKNINYFDEWNTNNTFKRVAGLYANHFESYGMSLNNFYFQCQIQIWYKDSLVCAKKPNCI